MKHEQLGPYRIVRLVGRGGMGAVYEAVETATGDAVAIKMLASHLADDAGLRRRFFAEIETLKTLVHPGVVRLLAFGEEDGQPYFAMELVRGTSLDERLRRDGPFDWRRTVEVATKLARSLKAAHDHGVVHRDLKPANVLLGDDGSIKLADFGIAKLFGNTSLTAHGSVVGTAEYMAPEQACGQPADHRVDLYALGAVMFAMLTGHPPFRGATASEIFDKQKRQPPPRLSSMILGIPQELADLVDRLLSRDPSKRPATALVLVRLLEAIEAAAAQNHAARSDSDDAVGDVFELAPTGVPANGSAITTADEEKRPVDLLAPTLVHVDSSGHGEGAGEQALPSGSTTQVDAPRQTRFTTVETLARAEEERRRWEARRHHALRSIPTLLTLAAAFCVAYLFLRPLSVDELHSRIMEAVDRGDDLREARPLIERFLARHGDDPRADDVRRLADTISIDELERALRRTGRRAGGATSTAQRDYLRAMARADESASAGITALEAWLAIHGVEAQPGADAQPGIDAGTEGAATPTPQLRASGETWQALVRRQVERLTPAAAAERSDDAKRLARTFQEAARLDAASSKETDPKQAGILRARRLALLTAIVELFSDEPHARDAVRDAQRLIEIEQERQRSPGRPAPQHTEDSERNQSP